MIGGWVFGLFLVSGLVALFGLPLLAVGVVLRLCETSWGKGRGELGSTSALAIGGLLCLPLICLGVVGWICRLFQ